MVVPFLLNMLAYAAFLYLLLFTGNDVCRWAVKLAERGPGEDTEKNIEPDEDQLNAGRIIGILERGLVAIGIIAMRWEVMAAVIALKTVARYKELEEQIQAEYFLIGSMASLLWAVLVTGALVWFDGTAGFKFLTSINAG